MPFALMNNSLLIAGLFAKQIKFNLKIFVALRSGGNCFILSMTHWE